MKYLINDIVKSKHHIGSTFYICAYQPGKNNIRALQNIKCTKVIIQDVDMYNSVVQYPTTFYYSEVAIIGLYKNGEPNYNKTFQPFDNTSFKSRENGPINFFDNKEECELFYLSLIK